VPITRVTAALLFAGILQNSGCTKEAAGTQEAAASAPTAAAGASATTIATPPKATLATPERAAPAAAAVSPRGEEASAPATAARPTPPAEPTPTVSAASEPDREEPTIAGAPSLDPVAEDGSSVVPYEPWRRVGARGDYQDALDFIEDFEQHQRQYLDALRRTIALDEAQTNALEAPLQRLSADTRRMGQRYLAGESDLRTLREEFEALRSRLDALLSAQLPPEQQAQAMALLARQFGTEAWLAPLLAL